MADRPPLTLRKRNVPALDGVRALAIVAVIAYHLGAPFMRGGYLGVDLFFVLSGFLITTLLVEEWLDTGSLSLRAFWARRARRLLPGLLLMLVVLGIFLVLFGGGTLANLSQVRGDAIATVLYFANWHLLFAHQSYFSQFAAPSPLQHTWSLAIEEQFYLVWPLVVLGVLVAARARWRLSGALVAIAGAASSAAWMAWLAAHHASIDRLYYGTDTRAFDLLVGAALAMICAGRPQPGARTRRILACSAPVALAVLVWFAVAAPQASSSAASAITGGAPGQSMFEWGFLVCAAAAAVLLADVRQLDPSPTGRVLGTMPMTFVGRISYELYLWHWPVIVELTPARLGVSGAGLDAIRLAVTLACSVASYFLVDQPLRRFAAAGWPRPARLAAVPAGMCCAAAVMVLGTMPVAASTAPEQHVATGSHVPGSGHVLGGPIKLAEPPTKSHPLHVILFGDSVMRGEAPAVTASLDSTKVVTVRDQGYDGWGLTTDGAWRENVPGAIRQYDSELVVVMWSFDDDFLLAHPRTYRRQMEQFVHVVLRQPSVDGLVFEEFPQLGPPPVSNPVDAATDARKRNKGVDAWDRLVVSMVSLDPARIMYLPLAPAVERDGRFEAWLPPGNRWSLPARRWVRVRMLDGVHLCAPGAARYAAALYADLTAMYHLPPPEPKWSTGPWTKSRDYVGTPDECPNDHP